MCQISSALYLGIKNINKEVPRFEGSTELFETAKRARNSEVLSSLFEKLGLEEQYTATEA